jgi:hypothetical protein
MNRNGPDALPRFRTASGGIVTIEAPGHDLGDPWFSAFRVVLERPYAGVPAGSQLRNFETAPAGNIEELLARVRPGLVVEELSLQGGRLLIGRVDEDGQYVAGWTGRWHEVRTWLPPTDKPAHEALRSFDGLRFHDSPLGVRVELAPVPAARIEAEDVIKMVPGVGILNILRADSAAGLVPAWSGARVRSGEVWRKTDESTSEQLLLHVSVTAVSVLYGETPLGNAQLNFLDQLVDLSWTTN